MANPRADNLDDSPRENLATKNGLIFGACILAACLGAAAYIQYTAPNLGIFL